MSRKKNKVSYIYGTPVKAKSAAQMRAYTSYSARTNHEPVVYVAYIPNQRTLKVGCTTNITKRMCRLQSENAHKVICLGLIQGDYDVEVELLTTLADYNIRGEWFKATPTTRAIIAAFLGEQNSNEEAA